ncbi:MAG TPA: hypothetical protein VFQ43_05545 [Nitrososphaera sp.]|nr:hypothetical protein [Nitrososphaera sp.]
MSRRLAVEHTNFWRWMIVPNGAHETGRTKKSWISFYDEEAEQVLNQYLAETGITSGSPLRTTESGIRKGVQSGSIEDGDCCKAANLEGMVLQRTWQAGGSRPIR